MKYDYYFFRLFKVDKRFRSNKAFIVLNTNTGKVCLSSNEATIFQKGQFNLLGDLEFGLNRKIKKDEFIISPTK